MHSNCQKVLRHAHVLIICTDGNFRGSSHWCDTKKKIKATKRRKITQSLPDSHWKNDTKHSHPYKYAHILTLDLSVLLNRHLKENTMASAGVLQKQGLIFSLYQQWPQEGRDRLHRFRSPAPCCSKNESHLEVNCPSNTKLASQQSFSILWVSTDKKYIYVLQSQIIYMNFKNYVSFLNYYFFLIYVYKPIQIDKKVLNVLKVFSLLFWGGYLCFKSHNWDVSPKTLCLFKSPVYRIKNCEHDFKVDHKQMLHTVVLICFTDRAEPVPVHWYPAWRQLCPADDEDTHLDAADHNNKCTKGLTTHKRLTFGLVKPVPSAGLGHEASQMQQSIWKK